jgi:hypothetical protein
VAQLRKDVRCDLGDFRPFTIFFDGATRRGELIVIVYRAILDDLTVIQRLFSLRTELKSVNADVLAGIVQLEIAEVLGVTADDFHRLVCATHDSASVNRAAMRQLVYMIDLYTYLGSFNILLNTI